MQHYRQHVIPTRPHRPRQWWFGFALVAMGVLILLYGIADMWDTQSDARVQHAAEQATAAALEAMKPTILGAYMAGREDGAARAGSRCKRGAL